MKRLGRITNPLWGTIIGTIIAGVVLTYAIPGLFSHVWHYIKYIWETTEHDYIVDGLLATVVVLYVICSFVLLIIILCKKLSRPAHLKYTKEIIFGLQWRWSWDGVEMSEDVIKDLRAYCQDCESELMIYTVGLGTIFQCDLCGKMIENLPGDVNDIKNNTKREILRHIRLSKKHSQNHNNARTSQNRLPLTGNIRKIPVPSSTTKQTARAMKIELGAPSAKQIRIISDALDELPEKGPRWIGSKTYTISKLTTQHPKSLVIKKEGGKVSARIEMPMTTTPWVTIPEQYHSMF